MNDEGRGLEYGLLAANVCAHLVAFARQCGGRVAVRPAARLGDDLWPDLIYLRPQTLSQVENRDRPLTLPPDLVVDVVPATAAWSEVEAVARGYTSQGVPLVWIIDPYSQCVHVFGAGRDDEIFTGLEVVPGDGILPGWACTAATLLQIE